MLSKTFRLNIQNSALFICDMQERFRPLIYRFPSIVNKCSLMAEVSNLLEIPKIVSEQYPQALGKTIPELLPYTQDSNSFVYSKKQFSMMTPELTSMKTRNQILLCGIEAHVCISQTACDLLDAGYQVYVLCDAVSSQRPHDRSVALQRMQLAGAILTTTEAAIFDLMKTADHPRFRDISKLAKASNENKELNEFCSDITF